MRLEETNETKRNIRREIIIEAKARQIDNRSSLSVFKFLGSSISMQARLIQLRKSSGVLCFVDIMHFILSNWSLNRLDVHQ